MADDARIEDLRRRVHDDPASIAFAQLAEDLRRNGRCQEAVTVCRSGLATYPDYVSARVTLSRALIALDLLDDAARELERVNSTDPESLTAARAFAELRARRGHPPARGADTATTPAIPVASMRTASEKTTVDGREYLRIVRTLAALESWLAAIHVTRPERRA